jgi:hypothetical protein
MEQNEQKGAEKVSEEDIKAGQIFFLGFGGIMIGCVVGYMLEGYLPLVVALLFGSVSLLCGFRLSNLNSRSGGGAS